MKEKAIIYPYSASVSSIVRYREIINKYEIVGAVSPSGISIHDQDCAAADEGELTGIITSNDFCSSLNNCETVIIADFPMEKNEEFYKKIKENILLAINNSKNLLILLDIEDKDIELFKELSRNQKVSITCYQDLHKKFDSDSFQIRQIETPLVIVTGLYEDSSKFETQLALRKNLTEKGIRVSQIGTKHYCELFGFHSYPKYMYDNTLNEEQRILKLNDFIHHIEINEVPDIIIMGVPFGLLPINSYIHQKFGIPSYYVGCAISTATVILNIPLSNPNSWDFDSIGQMIQYKIGNYPTCICMSNNRVNVYDLGEEHKGLSIDRLPFERVNKLVDEWTDDNVPLFSSVSKEGQKLTSEFLIEYLNLQNNNDKSELKNKVNTDRVSIKEWLDELLNTKFRILNFKNDNCLMEMHPRNYVYIQAEIMQKFGTAITLKQIENGQIFTKTSLVDCIYNNLQTNLVSN